MLIFFLSSLAFLFSSRVLIVVVAVNPVLVGRLSHFAHCQLDSALWTVDWDHEEFQHSTKFQKSNDSDARCHTRLDTR